ncbi:hypothetical protein GCM10010954_11880 [Halobacillus andaensis]|uniref:Lipoprotein n=1 Tax=Halobacillus andaensis TaxID=1176239 RepID=A0A917B0X4_HALAA|nr:hypothetical protein [Halobacillus andaensis]MBP2003985.1 hypothetical protein [Halobacillus andaensis]GGF14903.1 hypothetical protein GCM10010954_11880 [Halobacillus andaensis]
MRISFIKKCIYTAGSLFILVSAAGCFGGETYKFVGESDHWEGSLNISKDSNTVQKEFMVTYKGEVEELSEIERISFGYDAGTSSSEVTRTIDREPTEKHFITESSATGDTRIEEGDVIEATVQWDDQEETFEMEVE